MFPSVRVLLTGETGEDSGQPSHARLRATHTDSPQQIVLKDLVPFSTSPVGGRVVDFGDIALTESGTWLLEAFAVDTTLNAAVTMMTSVDVIVYPEEVSDADVSVDSAAMLLSVTNASFVTYSTNSELPDNSGAAVEVFAGTTFGFFLHLQDQYGNTVNISSALMVHVRDSKGQDIGAKWPTMLTGFSGNMIRNGIGALQLSVVLSGPYVLYLSTFGYTAEIPIFVRGSTVAVSANSSGVSSCSGFVVSGVTNVAPSQFRTVQWLTNTDYRPLADFIAAENLNMHTGISILINGSEPDTLTDMLVFNLVLPWSILLGLPANSISIGLSVQTQEMQEYSAYEWVHVSKAQPESAGLILATLTGASFMNGKWIVHATLPITLRATVDVAGCRQPRVFWRCSVLPDFQQCGIPEAMLSGHVVSISSQYLSPDDTYSFFAEALLDGFTWKSLPLLVASDGSPALASAEQGTILLPSSVDTMMKISTVSPLLSASDLEQVSWSLCSDSSSCTEEFGSSFVVPSQFLQEHGSAQIAVSGTSSSLCTDLMLSSFCKPSVIDIVSTQDVLSSISIGICSGSVAQCAVPSVALPVVPVNQLTRFAILVDGQPLYTAKSGIQPQSWSIPGLSILVPSEGLARYPISDTESIFAGMGQLLVPSGYFQPGIFQVALNISVDNKIFTLQRVAYGVGLSGPPATAQLTVYTLDGLLATSDTV
eukprot:gene744-2520_t